MFSVREMLKKNNIDLKISDAALDLEFEFEGNFVFSHRSKESKFILDGPKEYVDGFQRCVNEGWLFNFFKDNKIITWK